MTATSIYNAYDYGAVGDGVTDDTQALIKALNASVTQPDPGGAYCYYAPGIYLISDTIPVPANGHLKIDGRLVMNAGLDVAMVTIKGSNVTIDGHGCLVGNGSPDGNNSSLTNAGGIVTPSPPPSYSNIRIKGHLTIQDTGSWGLNLQGVTGATVTGLTITNAGAANQFAAGAMNCHARGLVISGTNDYGFAFYNGVTDCSISDSHLHDNNVNIGILTDGAYGTNTAPLPSSGIRIVGNHCFRAKKNPGIAVRAATCPPLTGPLLTGCFPITHSNIAILNNHLYNNGDGSARGGGGIQVTTTDTCTIADNTCSGDLGDEIVMGDDNPADSSSFWICSNITILGNKCYGSALSGSCGIAIRAPDSLTYPLHELLVIRGNTTNGNASNGIYVAGVKDCVVSSNTCTKDRGAGISVGKNVAQLQKHSNTINGVQHDTADTSSSDVMASSAAARLADTHNLAWSTDGQMNYGVQGGPNNNVMMHGLWIGGWAIAPTNYDISGLNVQQTDNGVPIVGGPTTIGTAARAPQVGAYAFGTAVTVPAATKVLAPGWVSVQDFGAVGDGATDDTTAITSAVAYAQDHALALYFPAGTYVDDGNHTIATAGLRIFGDGDGLTTILAGTVAAQTLYEVTADDVVIDGLTFDSNGAVVGPAKPAPTLQLSGRRCRIADCTFTNYEVAIQLLNVASPGLGYTRIVGNKFLGNPSGTFVAGAAINWTGVHDDVQIVGNRFGLGNASGGVNCSELGVANGITVQGNLFCEDASPACIGDTQAVARKQYWTIGGNIFESISTALQMGYSTQSGSDAFITFIGNSVQLWNSSNTGAVAIDSASGTGGVGTKALCVVGNQFDDTGVATETAALADPFLLTGFTLTGNTVTTTADGATLGTQALTLTEDQAVIGNNSGAPVQLTSAQPGGNWAAIACPTLGPGTLPVPPILDYNPTNTGTPVTVLTYTPASSAGSTPPVAGLYTLDLYVRIVSGATTITLLVTYTDATGSQTITIFNNVTQPVGSYSVPRVVLSAVGGQPITVAVTVSAFNQAYVSATLRAG